MERGVGLETRSGEDGKCTHPVRLFQQLGDENGALNIAKRRFAMKSRLNLLPVKKVRSRFNNYPQPNLWCCRCRHTEETLPHVLNHCKPVMEQILKRHDRIMGEVLNHILQQHFTRISVDEVCLAHAQQTGENLRPDVILEWAGGTSSPIVTLALRPLQKETADSQLNFPTPPIRNVSLNPTSPEDRIRVSSSSKDCDPISNNTNSNQISYETLRARLTNIISTFFNNQNLDELHTLEEWTESAGIFARETSRAKPRFNRGATRHSIRNRGTGRTPKTTTSAEANRNNALQEPFWRNQRDTVRKITDGEKGAVKCRISPQVLEERFRADLQKPSANKALEGLPDWINVDPNVYNASGSVEDMPILPREVEAVLRS